MERFRLRVMDQPKRGLIWELKLFPDMPGLHFREKMAGSWGLHPCRQRFSGFGSSRTRI